MFLAPTPPRFTRRSRLSNILLLLLRAAALTLLALAFARPFLRQDAATSQSQSPGRRIALLVDTSASMRRGDLWARAQKQVDEALADITHSDEVALFLFDRGVRPAFTFEQWNRLEPAQRAPSLRAQLAAAQPTWASTRLGDALANIAEQLAANDDADASKDSVLRKLVLISDIQQGSHAETLQGRQWPDAVVLEVRPVTLDESANASLQLIRPQPDAPDAADQRPRVRVTNSAGSSTERFSVGWANRNGGVPTTQPQQVYVAPGRGQVVRVDWPTDDQSSDRLVLQGDGTDFDNTLYVVRPRQETVRLLYIGDDQPDDAKGSAFYLGSALGDTPQRRVEFVLRRDEPLVASDLSGAGLNGLSLIVITKSLADDQAMLVREFINTGGDVLWVIPDAAAQASVRRVTGIDSLQIEEAASRDFSLVSRLDLEHRLFTAFADTRFSDFSRVHFWKHRKITLPTAAAPVSAAKAPTTKTLAWFDNGDPFLLETPIGQGRLILASSGWQPADSQLALSTKFVPMLSSLLQSRNAHLAQTQLVVGDAIPAPPSSSQPGVAGPKWTIKDPDGRAVEMSGSGTESGLTDRPGIYTISDGDQQFPLALNLDPDESRTAPLSPSDFKQWGAKFDTGVAAQASGDSQRQLKFFELENRQKMWQWLLVGVLGLVAAETALAGRLARRSTQPSVGSASEQVTV